MFEFKEEVDAVENYEKATNQAHTLITVLSDILREHFYNSNQPNSLILLGMLDDKLYTLSQLYNQQLLQAEAC